MQVNFIRYFYILNALRAKRDKEDADTYERNASQYPGVWLLVVKEVEHEGSVYDGRTKETSENARI
jgi:hypothetical protein